MDFNKSGASEEDRIIEMLKYCSEIIKQRRQEDKSYNKIGWDISAQLETVEIIRIDDGIIFDETILKIKYDEKNSFFYFQTHTKLQGKTYENRTVIEDEEHFHIYFNNIVSWHIRR
ncbi:hypothetical protein U8V72_15365 [Priestia filamentosa]|uniref:hypothetical protein n=1 Tax=Priestia filamentosa TaxID=1402861 RepID=UPI0005891734